MTEFLFFFFLDVQTINMLSIVKTTQKVIFKTLFLHAPAHQAHFPSTLQAYSFMVFGFICPLFLSVISRSMYMLLFPFLTQNISLCLLPFIFFFKYCPLEVLLYVSQRAASIFFVTIWHSLVTAFLKPYCIYQRRFGVHSCLYYVYRLMMSDFFK